MALGTGLAILVSMLLAVVVLWPVAGLRPPTVMESLAAAERAPTGEREGRGGREKCADRGAGRQQRGSEC